MTEGGGEPVVYSSSFNSSTASATASDDLSSLRNRLPSRLRTSADARRQKPLPMSRAFSSSAFACPLPFPLPLACPFPFECLLPLLFAWSPAASSIDCIRLTTAAIAYRLITDQ